MLARALATLAALFLLLPAQAADQPRVRLDTSLGPVVVELDPAKAPETVKNFLAYVDAGFYDGTVFHRVISGFMAQGGGFTAQYQQKPTRPPVKNEATNGLKNQRGTIAMARTSDPHSATAQFFINLVNNGFLDHSAPSGNGWGYAVFGRVVEGMEVVDRMAQVPTGAGGPFARDVPREPILIRKATRVGGAR